MPGTIPEAVVVVSEAFEGINVDKWGLLIGQAAELAPRRLIVDLRGSPVVDAAAVAILLRTHRTMVHADGRLTLRGPTTRVLRILRLARLDQVFDIEDPQTVEAVDV